MESAGIEHEVTVTMKVRLLDPRAFRLAVYDRLNTEWAHVISSLVVTSQVVEGAVAMERKSPEVFRHVRLNYRPGQVRSDAEIVGPVPFCGFCGAQYHWLRTTGKQHERPLMALFVPNCECWKRGDSE